MGTKRSLSSGQKHFYSKNKGVLGLDLDLDESEDEIGMDRKLSWRVFDPYQSRL